jgi:phosphoglycolate phosphatase-like HAD superfamily hydrolase
MNRKIIIWDWDGVVVDSITYKYVDIWKEVFPERPDLWNVIADYLNTSEGRSVNRYGLIKRALVADGVKEIENLDGEELKNYSKIEERATLYANAVRDNIEKMLIPEAAEALKELAKVGHHMYVVSGGGSDADLVEAAEKLGLKKYFKGFFGFGDPKMPLVSFGKFENFEQVAKQEKTKNPNNYVVIGDGDSDYQLAKEIGCQFIAIGSSWNNWAENEEMKPRLISSIKDLPQRIRELQ